MSDLEWNAGPVELVYGIHGRRRKFDKETSRGVVQAQLYGPFAVHASGPKTYRVTHRPTGRVVTLKDVSLASAMRLCEHLLPIADWDHISPGGCPIEVEVALRRSAMGVRLS